MTAFMSPLERKLDTTYQPSDMKDYIQLMNLHQPDIDNNFRSRSSDSKTPVKCHENPGNEKQTDILSSKKTG